MKTVDLPPPARALAIGAHADDIEFGAGGTLAKWAAAGCRVHLLVLTDGSKGSWEPEENIENLVQTRQREARSAARALGARDVHFLSEVDGELEASARARAQVCRAIREVQPDVVLGHDPWKRYRLHPDHRHAGFLTLDAVVAARDPHFHREQGLVAHRPRTILLFEAEEPDHVENVEDHLDAKLSALLEHRSQWRSTMNIGEDPEGEIPVFEAQVRREAEEAGSLAGTTAGEAFKRIDDV